MISAISVATWTIAAVVISSLSFLPYNNAQSYGDDEDSCHTPNYESGRCVVIASCQPLLTLLMEKPISRDNVLFLQQSQCGFEGKYPKVCCGSSGQPVGQITTPKPHPITKPPSGGVYSDLLPSTSQCGLGTNPRIFGGEVAELDDFPWMVLLEYQKPRGRGFYCGGVLINNRYVVTAAHCVVGKDIPRNWRLDSVRLGEYDTSTDQDCISNRFNSEQYCSDAPIDVKVEQSIAHSEYGPRDPNQYHDIALLRLAENVQYTGFIKPICLPTSPELLAKTYVGKSLFVAGWGKTEKKSESSVKLKLLVPVQANDVCTPKYRSSGVTLSDSQICAGGVKGKDSCRGDSGGPLMTQNLGGTTFNWFLAGVVSFGPTPCGLEDWPGVYTRVADYMPWIVSQLRP